jgi:hypothetical protein
MTNTESFWEDPDTDTPRCDLEQKRIEGQFPPHLTTLAMSFARRLERELNEQRRRIYDLEEEIERLTLE